MHHFHYKGTELHCEEVPVRQITETVGTPCYVYSHATLSRHLRVFDEAFRGIPHLICYAMKANSNLAVVRALVKQGAGIDIVSGGELFRARAAGVAAGRIVYSGVGKTAREMADALREGILQFNVESEAELLLLDAVARRLGRKAPVSIRVNPDIDPRTHPYISTGLKKSKFGVPMTESLRLYRRALGLKGIRVQGVSCHIGSQITKLAPFREALKKISDLVLRLRRLGCDIQSLDLGGGLGIPYDDEVPPHPQDYGNALRKGLSNLGCRVLLEPGRAIVGNAGILVTQVLYRKEQRGKRFVVVDGAMNDLIRPSLYGSFHQIVPVRKRRGRLETVDVVGPICESGDFFAENRPLPVVENGDLLAVMSAGAYGFSMASNYNARPRAAEVLVSGRRFYLVRQRETMRDLVRGEKIPRFLA